MNIPYEAIAVGGAILVGSTVSACAGFAGLAAAGAVLLQWYPAQLAIPLVMACSTVTQLICLVYLRPKIEWRSHMPLYAGGGMGVLAAIRLSDEVNLHAFKVAFGTLLICYVVYMIGRRSAAVRISSGSILSTSAVGFAGGLVGGFTAMPSAVPTLWCDLRGIAKEEQRGILQPYMTAMQALSIVLLLAHEGAVDADFPRTFMTAFPLTIAGSWLGLRFFARFDEQRFRCVVLLLILLSGIALLR